MKIGIIGFDTIGLEVAAQAALVFLKHGIEAEARQATLAEETQPQYMERVVQEICMRTLEQPVFAFEPPRFTGYVNHRRKHPAQKMKVVGWK